MFKDNKYTKWYYDLIAKSAALDVYTELHHIIPKCLGGSDAISNLVSLTAREHFVAHLLLTKMTDDHRLKFALHMMTIHSTNHGRIKIKNSRLFAYIKQCNSEASSERNRAREYKTGFVTAISPNGEIKRFNDTESIPNGWLRGSGTSGKHVNRGKIYAYEPDSNIVKAFDNKSDIPNNWVLGNPNASKAARKSNIKGSSYYHNPLTGDEIRIHSMPKGWVKGRSMMWFNNGIENRQFNRILSNQPEGWQPGRIIKWTRK